MGSQETIAARPEDQLKMESKATTLRVPETGLKRDTAPPKPESRWNTENLALRLAADVASASSAGALLAPLISIIDKYVYEPPASTSFSAQRVPKGQH